MYDIKEFTAIINPPQSAILSVGSIEAAPAPPTLNEGRDIVRVVRVTLSCDARVIHYELACQWLDMFRSIVHHPTAQGLL